jgi:hypothetical protein
MVRRLIYPYVIEPRCVTGSTTGFVRRRSQRTVHGPTILLLFFVVFLHRGRHVALRCTYKEQILSSRPFFPVKHHTHHILFSHPRCDHRPHRQRLLTAKSQSGCTSVSARDVEGNRTWMRIPMLTFIFSFHQTFCPTSGALPPRLSLYTASSRTCDMW